MSGSKPAFSTMRVLYLEDEPLIALDTMDRLNSCGFGVLVGVSTLRAALTASGERTFDCAILDINLDRGQKSIALGRDLHDAGTKVIFASGNSQEEAGLRAQGFRFVVKPFDLSELVREIAASLDRGA